jgi:hypothetical protein
VNEKTPKLLDDIRDQARFILSITADKSLQEYSANRVLRQALEPGRGRDPVLQRPSAGLGRNAKIKDLTPLLSLYPFQSR